MSIFKDIVSSCLLCRFLKKGTPDNGRNAWNQTEAISFLRSLVGACKTSSDNELVENVLLSLSNSTEVLKQISEKLSVDEVLKKNGNMILPF